jgi:hypothetical protein
MAEFLRPLDVIPPKNGPRHVNYWVKLFENPTLVGLQDEVNVYLVQLANSSLDLSSDLIDTQYAYVPATVGPIVPASHVMKCTFMTMGGLVFVVPA